MHVHNRSVAAPRQTVSGQTRDWKGKPKTTTVSLPGPTEHASATRTRGSEEQVAGVFFSINDDRNCNFTLLGREQTNNHAELLAVIAARGKSTMEISRSGQTVNTSCEWQPVVFVVRPRSVRGDRGSVERV